MTARIGISVDLERDGISGIGVCADRLLARLPVSADAITVFYGKGNRFTAPPRAGLRETAIRPWPGVPSTLRKAAYFMASCVACDLVHETTNIGWILPTRSRFRKVLEVHDVIAATCPEYAQRGATRAYRALQARAVSAADALIVSSRHTADMVRRNYPDVPAAKMTVVYRGHDAELFNPAPASDDAAKAASGEPGYLLFVGMLSPRKNLARCLAALAAARRDGCAARLVIAGKAGWGSEELVAELLAGKHPGATYLGGVATERLPALYRGARALLWPSLYEGFGIPIIEAMACGTPVITANRTGTAEAAGDAGLLVDPESVPAIADAIRRIHNEPQLARQLRDAGLKWSAAFTWQRYAEEIYGVYQRLLG